MARDAAVFALDPGVTTGWAVVNKKNGVVLGMGNLSPEELGCGLDLIVRSFHRQGYVIHPVVEQVPSVRGTTGQLATTLAFVNRTIDHWLEDIFDLNVSYVPPGTWKNSRVAITSEAPKLWNGVATSQHMRDAYLLGVYTLESSRQASTSRS